MARRFWLVVALVCLAGAVVWAERTPDALLAELKASPCRIVYESFRDDNWELMLMNADGSNRVNLTNTPDVDEIYPKASPDGTRIAFLENRGEGDERVRDIGIMDVDGGNRKILVENGRQPFWSPDGKVLGYAKQDDGRYPKDAYANNGLYFLNLETGVERKHPKDDIKRLLTPCWSPDGAWIVCSATGGGLGFGHSIAVFEANGDVVSELIRARVDDEDIYQCRPDFHPDGKRVAWGTTNTKHKSYMWIEVAEVDFGLKEPKIVKRERPLQVDWPLQTYHVDFSPCGTYIAYGQGPLGSRMLPSTPVLGNKAPDWDIWVCDAAGGSVAVQLTHDGLSNKEPDWVFGK